LEKNWNKWKGKGKGKERNDEEEEEEEIEEGRIEEWDECKGNWGTNSRRILS